MKATITRLIVVAALSFSYAALAAEETRTESMAPETAAEPAPPAQAPQPAVKSPTPVKGKPRPKNLDLRHCLELKTDAEIAKCAGEQ